MSCWHGGHGCGPWYGGRCGPGWSGETDWYGEADWPMRRPYRRSRRPEPETPDDELEARLDALREEVRRVKAELMNLRGPGEIAAGKS